MALSVTRRLPPNFIGVNFSPFQGKITSTVPAFMDEGFTMFTPGKIEKTGVSGTDGSTQITVSNNSGIVVGQYVTGVGIPACNKPPSSPELTKVVGINNNIITLNTNLNINLVNATVTFHPVYNSLEYQIALMAASGVEIVRFGLQWDLFEKTKGNINWKQGKSNSLPANDNNQWNLDNLMYLLAKNGIQAMPRLAQTPRSWAADWDYAHDIDHTGGAFITQDPNSDSFLSKVGIKLTAQGISGNDYITTSNMKRGFMIIQGMLITGTGIPSNTKVVSVIKNTDHYRINLDKNLTGAVSGTNNITAGIQNYATNNPSTESLSNLVFDTIQDFNIFLTHLERKGGRIPKDFDDAARFMNAAADRYGNDGTFWTDSSMWPAGSAVNRTASGVTSGTDSTAISYNQKITISSPADLVIGMYIEDNFTNTDGNNAFIQPDTRIIAIDGTTLLLDKPLLKTMPSGTAVTIKYPRVTYWQIGNEMDHLTNKDMEITALIKSTPSGPNKTLTYKAARGQNWPQHKRNQTWITDVVNGKGVLKEVVLNDEQYSFAPSFLEMVSKIKKEIHAVDPKAQIVLGAPTTGPTNNNRDPQYISNIEEIDTMSAAQKIFDPRIGNGKNKFDIYSINVYTSVVENTIAYLQDNILPFIKKYFYPNTSATQIQPSVLPKVMISEYGWSTAVVEVNGKEVALIQGAVNENQQSANIDNLIGFSNTKMDFGDFVNPDDPNYDSNWIHVASIYYRWASNQTVPAIAGRENWRGLYKYNTANSTFVPKLSAQTFAEEATYWQGRR